MALPDKQFMLTTLKTALDMHDDALGDATPIQKLVWQTNVSKFIEEAKPLDALSLECVFLLDTALIWMIRHNVPAETALRYAKCLHKKFALHKQFAPIKRTTTFKRKPGRVRAGRVKEFFQCATIIDPTGINTK